MEPRPLSVAGVWKGYSRGANWTEVLADVSFDVQPGEVVAIAGGRLEGKTTLLKIAAGMERPDKGAVSLGDLQLPRCRDSEQSRLLGHRIMWIDRRGPRLKTEVEKFVGWPLALHGHGRRRAEQAAAQMLRRVGAQQCLGRCWGDLSDWQRMLVSLARAFAGTPQVVVIDDLLDAFGGQGTEEASDLLRGLIEASEPRCGVLMSASDMESAVYADKVWSITAKKSLRLLAAPPPDGTVVQFPGRDSLRVGG